MACLVPTIKFDCDDYFMDITAKTDDAADSIENS